MKKLAAMEAAKLLPGDVKGDASGGVWAINKINKITKVDKIDDVNSFIYVYLSHTFVGRLHNSASSRIEVQAVHALAALDGGRCSGRGRGSGRGLRRLYLLQVSPQLDHCLLFIPLPIAILIRIW